MTYDHWASDMSTMKGRVKDITNRNHNSLPRMAQTPVKAGSLRASSFDRSSLMMVTADPALVK